MGFVIALMMEMPVRKVLQSSCKGLQVVVIEAQQMLKEVAGPRAWSDTRQSWLARAARRLGFSYARTSNIYYGRARIIRAEEWIRLNDEAEQLKKSAQQRQEALHDLDLLARAAVAARGEAARPMGVERGKPGEAGPRPVDPAAGRPVR